MISSWGDLAVAIALGVILVLAPVLIAALRGPVVNAVTSLFDIVAQPVAAVARACRDASRHFRQAIHQTRHDLAYGGGGEEGATREPSTWDVLGPITWLVVHGVTLVGEFSLSVLTFAAMFGLGKTNVPFQANLDTTTGLLWAAVIVTFGLALLDLLHLSPLHRPYGMAEGRTRKVLIGCTLAGIILSGVATTFFFLWRQAQLDNKPGTFLFSAFLVMFGVLLVGALALSGFALLVNVAVFKLLFLFATWLVLGALLIVFGLVFRIIDAAAALAFAIVDVFAGLGRIMWNWTAESRRGQRLRFGRIEDPVSERRPLLAVRGSPLGDLSWCDPASNAGSEDLAEALPAPAPNGGGQPERSSPRRAVAEAVAGSTPPAQPTP